MVRRSNIAVAAAFVVAALLLLTGCGQRSEPTGTKVDLYPVTVDQPGGPPIVLAQKPASVAALTPQAATLLSSVLGQTVEPERSPGKAELVVITPESLNKRTPRVYVAPDESISDVERALTELGLLLDRPIRARQVVANIESKRKSVRAHLRGVDPVSVFVDTGFFTTASTNSLLGDLIKEAGGKNIAGAAPQPGPFPVRTLRKLNPDLPPGHLRQRHHPRRPAPRSAHARARCRSARRPLCDPRRQGGAARGRGRDRAARDREVPPPGCVSLSSTRSRSTRSEP